MFCGNECQFSAGEFREKERVLWEVCNRVKGTKLHHLFGKFSDGQRVSLCTLLEVGKINSTVVIWK